MSAHSHRVSLLAAVSLVLVACSDLSLNPPPSTPTAVSPSASTSAEPTVVVTPSPAPQFAPTAIPPAVTGWVAREIPPDDDCCAIDAIDVTSTAGGTIHAVDHLEDASPNGGDAGRYRRTTDGGQTWEAEHLLPGIDEVVAVAEDRVFIAFQAYDCRSGIGVVRNDKNGAPKAWSRVTCLPGEGNLGGSEWGPQVTATGSSVYVVSVDSGTKKVHLRTSHDAGRTFASRTLGMARPDSDGFVGPVLISADDEVVAASWPDAGLPLVRVSHDGARTWGPEVPLPLGAAEELSVRDGRVLAQGPNGIEARWFGFAAGGAFERITAPQFSATPDPMLWTATRLVLGPESALGALTTEATCAPTWLTSTDSGATWSMPERIAEGCLGSEFGASSPLPVSWLDDGHIVAFLTDGDGVLIAERP